MERANNMEKAPLYNLMVNTPNHIVWIYPFVQTVRVYGFPVRTYYVMVGSSKGKIHRIKVKKDESTPIMQEISEFAKNARFGYNRDFEKLFRKNPGSLVDNE